MKLDYSRAKQFVRHVDALGIDPSDYPTLSRLEHKAHKLAEDECNGYISEEVYAQEVSKIFEKVAQVFKGQPPKGFKFNGDPRGYALKCDEIEGTQTDWGRNTILAPEW